MSLKLEYSKQDSIAIGIDCYQMHFHQSQVIIAIVVKPAKSMKLVMYDQRHQHPDYSFHHITITIVEQ